MVKESDPQKASKGEKVDGAIDARKINRKNLARIRNTRPTERLAVIKHGEPPLLPFQDLKNRVSKLTGLKRASGNALEVVFNRKLKRAAGDFFSLNNPTLAAAARKELLSDFYSLLNSLQSVEKQALRHFQEDARSSPPDEIRELLDAIDGSRQKVMSHFALFFDTEQNVVRMGLQKANPLLEQPEWQKAHRILQEFGAGYADIEITESIKNRFDSDKQDYSFLMNDIRTGVAILRVMAEYPEAAEHRQQMQWGINDVSEMDTFEKRYQEIFRKKYKAAVGGIFDFVALAYSKAMDNQDFPLQTMPKVRKAVPALLAAGILLGINERQLFETEVLDQKGNETAWEAWQWFKEEYELNPNADAVLASLERQVLEIKNNNRNLLSASSE